MIILNQIESNGMTIIQGCKINSSKYLDLQIIDINLELLQTLEEIYHINKNIQIEKGEKDIEV